MSLLCTSAIQHLWFLLLVPSLVHAEPSACSSADNTCSTHDAVPTMGEALLQRVAKREQSASADQVSQPFHVPHSYPSGSKSMIEIAEFNRVLSGGGLPPGAKDMFNEKLCKAKLGGHEAAAPSNTISKTTPSSRNMATDASQRSEAASTKPEYFPLSKAGSDDDSHDASGESMPSQESGSDDDSHDASGESMPSQESSFESLSDGMPRANSQMSKYNGLPNVEHVSADDMPLVTSQRSQHDADSQGASSRSMPRATSSQSQYHGFSDNDSQNAGARGKPRATSSKSQGDGSSDAESDNDSEHTGARGMPRATPTKSRLDESSETEFDNASEDVAHSKSMRDTPQATSKKPDKVLYYGESDSRDDRKKQTSVLSRDDKSAFTQKKIKDAFKVGRAKKNGHRSHKKMTYLFQKGYGKEGPAREEEHEEARPAEESETTGGFTKSFFSDWEPADMPSLNAPLDESGYKLVVSQKNDDEMKVYIRRVAQSCGMKVIDEGGLNGVVAWFSGVEDSSSFEELKVELFTALLAKSKDNWVAVKNSTGLSGSSASLDLIGYVQVRSLRSAKEMVKFVRRMVEHMGIKITNNGGFDGMMHYYSEPDDMESFQRLMSEIKKAVFEHSWAELD